jgi:gamma-glutamylputrescine oxidase
MAGVLFRPDGRSLWQATASLPPPGSGPLDKDVKTQVVIVGGGFTGLSSAHFLAREGFEVLVLDANSIGWGASGRNGGYVSQRFRVPFKRIYATHGKAVAARMRQITVEADHNIQQMIEELGIDCEFRRYGAVIAAHNKRALDNLHKSSQWILREFGEDAVEKLDRGAVRELTGSDAYVGGHLLSTAAALHPLNYVRGLARSLQERGVALHGQSPVSSIIDHGDQMEIRTPQSAIRADYVIVATNAYTNLTGFLPRVSRSLIPFQSAIIATAKLDRSILATILPQQHLLADTRRVLRYGRVSDGRFLFGGRGTLGGEAGSASYRRLQSEMIAAFPQLDNVPLEFGWSGLVAMTIDGLPRIGRLGKRVYYALGYNGAGVAMSNLMGKFLADTIGGKAVEPALLATPLPRIPSYSLRVPAVRAVTAWLQFLDRFG